jgi:hypothetical protein
MQINKLKESSINFLILAITIIINKFNIDIHILSDEVINFIKKYIAIDSLCELANISMNRYIDFLLKNSLILINDISKYTISIVIDIVSNIKTLTSSNIIKKNINLNCIILNTSLEIAKCNCTKDNLNLLVNSIIDINYILNSITEVSSKEKNIDRNKNIICKLQSISIIKIILQVYYFIIKASTTIHNLSSLTYINRAIYYIKEIDNCLIDSKLIKLDIDIEIENFKKNNYINTDNLVHITTSIDEIYIFANNIEKIYDIL